MKNKSYITCKKIIKIEHQKLRSQLKSAICWIRNYISTLMMTLVNNKIKICTQIPDFVCALSVNMLSKEERECAASSFLYINMKKECCEIKRKTFRKIAYYCHDGETYRLHIFDILPLTEYCHIDCNIQSNIKAKISQMEGFCKLFSEIINMSDAYVGFCEE